MTKIRKISATLFGAASLFAGTGMAGAQAKGEPDLFAFSEGARLVAYPDDVQISQMDSSPLNLIDGSSITDWTGQASPSPVFVLELAEQTELSRISFDAGPLNRDAKAVRSVTVEVSDTSSTSGFETVASVKLSRRENMMMLPTKLFPSRRSRPRSYAMFALTTIYQSITTGEKSLPICMSGLPTPQSMGRFPTNRPMTSFKRFDRPSRPIPFASRTGAALCGSICATTPAAGWILRISGAPRVRTCCPRSSIGVRKCFGICSISTRRTDQRRGTLSRGGGPLGLIGQPLTSRRCPPN